MDSKIGRREMIGAAGTALAVGTLATAATAQDAVPKMKVLGINTSPRKGKSTAAALAICLDAVKAQNPAIEIELIELAELSIPAQLAAGQPLRPGETDDFPTVAAKLTDPAVVGIIVGSPVYFGNMSALCKAFIDRCFEFRREGFKLGNKVVGALAVGGTRNGGQELTVQSILVGMNGQNMFAVGTGQPSVRIGATLWNQGDSIAEDEFGVGTAKDLGKRVAELATLLNR